MIRGPKILPRDGARKPKPLKEHATAYAQSIANARTCVFEADFGGHAHVSPATYDTEDTSVSMTYSRPVLYVLSS